MYRYSNIPALGGPLLLLHAASADRPLLFVSVRLCSSHSRFDCCRSFSSVAWLLCAERKALKQINKEPPRFLKILCRSARATSRFGSARYRKTATGRELSWRSVAYSIASLCSPLRSGCEDSDRRGVGLGRRRADFDERAKGEAEGPKRRVCALWRGVGG